MSSDSALKAMPRMPTLSAFQARLPAQLVHQEVGQALVDRHGHLAEREAVPPKGEQLHGVLHQAGTGGKAGAGNVGHARVTLAHFSEQPEVINARPARTSCRAGWWRRT